MRKKVILSPDVRTSLALPGDGVHKGTLAWIRERAGGGEGRVVLLD